MDKKIWLALAVVALLAVGWYVVSKNTSAPYASQTGGTEDVKTFAVSGNEFSFAPSAISVKKGETVKVVFTNTGKYPHNFVVDELGVKSETINQGATIETTFIASKAGAFAF
ncbi:MAG: cupredoxin domain-containing protein, partial [Patescibacteria group bacterium]